MMSPKVFQLGFSRSLMKIILICQMSICMCMTCCQRIHLGVVKGMRDETLERAKGEKYNKVIKIQSFPSLLLWEVRLQPGIAKCITFTENLFPFSHMDCLPSLELATSQISLRLTWSQLNIQASVKDSFKLLLLNGDHFLWLYILQWQSFHREHEHIWCWESCNQLSDCSFFRSKFGFRLLFFSRCQAQVL